MYELLSKKSQYKNSLKTTLGEHTSDNLKDSLSTYDFLDENYFSYYSKKIDDYGIAFSSQQMSHIDWEKFEKHTFFDSAVDKAQYAFKKIINYFPYDKSQFQKDQYLKSLDGYTRYVLDNVVPNNIGYLRFDGNNFVEIFDRNGFLLNDFDKTNIKSGLLNPKASNFSFDFWLRIDQDLNQNSNYIVFQKLSQNSQTGYTCYLSKQNNNLYINFILSNENNGYIKSSATISLEKFFHVNISCFSKSGEKLIEIYIDGKKIENVGLVNNFTNSVINDSLSEAKLFIGSGNNHSIVQNTTNFIGIIDEFRIFKKIRKSSVFNDESKTSIHAQSGLELYLTFNEINGSYTNNKICLDSSGNKLHGLIKNDNNDLTLEEISTLRTKFIDSNGLTVETPIIYEKKSDYPVLFPSYEPTKQKLQVILEKASRYDMENPNVFWNLFPSYLFMEASEFEKSSAIYASNELYTDGNKELDIKSPETSSLIKIVTIWARFFDQFKLYVDTISNSFDIDYDSINQKDVDGFTLPLALKMVGIDFKEIFPNMTNQKFESKNYFYEEVYSEKSIRKIQNILWKRFLINTQDYLRSKGTISSVNTVFNSFGIDKDTFFNLREYNTQNDINLKKNHINYKKNNKIICFLNKKDVFKNKTYDVNNRLNSGAVLEISNLLNNQNIKDKWTIQQFFKFTNIDITALDKKQSILRIDRQDNTPYINLVFQRKNIQNKFGDLYLYINETNQDSDVGNCLIENIEILDGGVYFINIEKKLINSTTSKYKLSIKRGLDSSKHHSFRSKSIILKNQNFYDNVQNDYSNSKLIVGNKKYENAIQTLSGFDYFSIFEGSILSLKFWNKTLSDKNIEELSLNTKNSISTERNILDLDLDSLKLDITLEENFNDNQNNAGSQIQIKNIGSFNSQNILYIGNSVVDKTILNSTFIVSSQNYNIDSPTSSNRVNINSIESNEYKDLFLNRNINPGYSFLQEKDYDSNVTTSIDFSSMRFLNEEISKILNVFDTMTQILSNRNSLFEVEYSSLNTLRNKFFEKLEKEINFKPLYQVYKYFDHILEEIIHEAIPSKVNYLGFNYIYESHLLERHKYHYKMSDSRLPYTDKAFENYYDGSVRVRTNQNRYDRRQEERIIVNNIFNIRNED